MLADRLLTDRSPTDPFLNDCADAACVDSIMDSVKFSPAPCDHGVRVVQPLDETRSVGKRDGDSPCTASQFQNGCRGAGKLGQVERDIVGMMGPEIIEFRYIGTPV